MIKNGCKLKIVIYEYLNEPLLNNNLMVTINYSHLSHPIITKALDFLVDGCQKDLINDGDDYYVSPFQLDTRKS